jgi:hypothetical protein
LPDDQGEEIGMHTIAGFLTNPDKINENIDRLILDQNIKSGNDRLFDDVSIIGVEFF